MGKSIYKVSKELQEIIIEDYKNNVSIRKISEKYDVTRPTVSRFLEEKGIKTTKGNHYRTYHHNESFFDVIDSEEKAYWLGFMFADGYIVDENGHYGQDKFGISLAKQDKKTLEDFAKAIQSNNPICIYPRKDNIGQPLCRILLTSQKTVDDLIKHGCVKQKSLILQPPIDVPRDLTRHFIRGFFDGDGSISKVLKQNKSQEYWYSINITSTYEMIEWIYNFFEMGSIIKEKRRDKTYYYSLGGHRQVIKFFHILYDNATIYMERKYNRFLEFVEKYDENWGIKV